MSYLQKLKDATSIHDFAPLLGFEPKKLAYLLFKERPSNKYTQFAITKKSGGLRTINAPQKGLKLAQICLDEGFKGNDQLKANAVQTFKARDQEDKESKIVFRTV